MTNKIHLVINSFLLGFLVHYILKDPSPNTWSYVIAVLTFIVVLMYLFEKDKK